MCSVWLSVVRVWTVKCKKFLDKHITPITDTMMLNDAIHCTVLVADREVDADILERVSLDIGNDWRYLGRQLGWNDAELDAVQFDFRDCGQNKTAYQMLHCWHERCGSDAKLGVLSRALMKIKRPDIALKLHDTPPEQ